jgi:hypothetical protein
MKLKNKIYIFLLIGLLSFLIDKYLYPSKKEEYISINLMHMIHHFLSNYLFFGSLIFGYYKYHLLIVAITVLHWLLNDDKCIISVIYNKNCGFEEDTRHRDIAYHIQKLININIFVMLSIIVLYDVYMIYKNTK